MRRLFILRPEPGAGRTAARAQALGLETVAAPLFAIQPLEWTAPDPARFDGLLLTSANALRHGGPELGRLRGLPTYAVGSATAEAAREAGFAIGASGEAGVDRLLSSLGGDLRLLHLHGEQVRPPIEAGQRIASLAVYRAAELPPPASLRSLENQVAAVHSPRAANRLRALCDELGIPASTVRLACISQAAAIAAGPGWDRAESAERPDDELLLALAARLCDKSPER